MKKENILEIINDDNNLIGSEDAPESGSNKETEAKGTTDSNVGKHGQNFKNDFLGRFGFYFYENNILNKNLVEEKLSKKDGDKSFVKKDSKDILRKEKLKKIADLLDKLSDNDVENLVSILAEKTTNNE